MGEVLACGSTASLDCAETSGADTSGAGEPALQKLQSHSTRPQCLTEPSQKASQRGLSHEGCVESAHMACVGVLEQISAKVHPPHAFLFPQVHLLHLRREHADAQNAQPSFRARVCLKGVARISAPRGGGIPGTKHAKKSHKHSETIRAAAGGARRRQCGGGGGGARVARGRGERAEATHQGAQPAAEVCGSRRARREGRSIARGASIPQKGGAGPGWVRRRLGSREVM